MPRKPRPKLRVYLPPELHQDLKQHSRANGVTMAHTIRTLIRSNLQAAARVENRQNRRSS